MKNTLTFRLTIVLFGLCAGLIACRPAPQVPAATDPTSAAPVISPTTSPPPTVTPSPSPPPPPTSFPTEAPPKILYEERFEDEITCFKLSTLEQAIQVSIADGAYWVNIEGDNSLTSQCRGGYTDFVMEYEVRLVEGNVHSVIGLRFRTYLGSSYNIYITGSNDLCWDFYDADADTFRNLAGCWGRLPENMDIRDTFRIRLIAADRRMAIVINDELVATATDRTNDYGTFGFFIANNGTGNTEVVIDNILIRELLQEDTDVFRIEQIG